MGAIMNGITLHGGTRVVRRHVPGVQRLHAPAGAAGRADEAADRSTSGRTTRSASAGTARPTSRSSTSPRCGRSPASTSSARPTPTRPPCAGGTILEKTDRPAGLALSRQNLPVLDPAKTADAAKGGYVLAEASTGRPEVILIATGSEVALALAARERARGRGHADPGRVDAVPRVVRRAAAVLPAAGAAARRSRPGSASRPASAGLARVSSATPARSSSIDHFGASAAGDVLFEQFGFTPDRVVAAAHSALSNRPGSPATPPPATDEGVTDMSDALADLSAQGVSVWLDDISRERLRTGNLQDLIDTKHVVGVTSNPTIFQKALEKGDAYDEQVRDLALREIAVDGAIRYLMAFDIRWACDVLRPVVRRAPTARTAGCRSRSTRASRTTPTGPSPRPRRLWWLVDRPNVMIKIPATDEGLPAITAATAAGHQRQRHADLLPRPLRRGHGRLPDRPRAGQGGRHRPVDDPLGRVVLRLPRRHRDRQAAGQDRHRRGDGAARQGRRRQRPAGLRALREGLRLRPLAGPRGRRRARAAPAVGLDRRQGPGLRRHDVRRRARRARTPSTPCPRRPWTRSPTTAQIQRRHDHRALRRRAQGASTRSPRSASSYDDVIEVLEVEGVQKFEDSYAQLAESVKAKLEKAK